jgi:hypothetical protein
MPTQKPDSAEPAPTPKPRSEALEAELAMLEAILPTEPAGSDQPDRGDPPKESGATR